MTEKQTIHCMKFNCELAVCEECDLYGTVGTDHCFEDACREAINALEKQIPKELTNIRKVKEYDGYDMGNCPVCGEPLDNSFYENLKYCFVCGQAIKWE